MVITSEEMTAKLEKQRLSEDYFDIMLFKEGVGVEQVTVNPRDEKYCGNCFCCAMLLDESNDIYSASCSAQNLQLVMESNSVDGVLRNEACIETERQKFGAVE